MKKNLLFVATLLGSVAFSQQSTGKVGVNTENPTETLQVQGTTRITKLPSKGESISTNGNGEYMDGQKFTPTKMVVADANGVLGTAALPSGGASSYTYKTYSGSSASNTFNVNLSKEPFYDIYIIKNSSTSNSGYNTIITLPVAPNTPGLARVIRIMVLATGSQGNKQGVIINGLSNLDNAKLGGTLSSNGYSLSNGAVSMGGSSIAAYERIYTIIGIEGKWYLDRSFR
ncbi:hypothetical protein ACT4RS_00445 [Ornithobacterium rhinotracheale]|uniref:hypothetical protein n=1 Tax=Ornithobacterium rhinotracheale TaxID=28251 RepID=UPI004035B122